MVVKISGLHEVNWVTLEQGSACFWRQSLNLLKKNYFEPEFSSKKCFVGRIDLEGLHWKLEKKRLQAQVSIKQVLSSLFPLSVLFVREQHFKN